MYQAQTPGAANATTKSSTAQITIDSYPKRPPQTWQITGQSVGVLGSRDLLHGVEDLRYSAIPSSDTSIPRASHNHTRTGRLRTAPNSRPQPIAEYLHLSEGGRHCHIEHRSARSGGPQRYPLQVESCGTRRACSGRGQGDAAVPVDDREAGRRWSFDRPGP